MNDYTTFEKTNSSNYGRSILDQVIFILNSDNQIVFKDKKFQEYFSEIASLDQFITIVFSSDKKEDISHQFKLGFSKDIEIRTTLNTDKLGYEGEFSLYLEIAPYTSNGKIERLVSGTLKRPLPNNLANRNIEEDFWHLFQNNQISVFIIDVLNDGTFRYVTTNEKHQKQTGIKLEDIEGKTPQELVGEEASIALIENYRNCASSKRVLNYEEKIMLPVGETYWLTSLTPIIRKGKTVSIIGTAVEISKIKQKEAYYKETKEQFELATRGANDGIWDWNVENNKVFYSNRWKEVLGYDEEYFEKQHLNFWNLLHPDDVSKAKTFIVNYLKGIEKEYELKIRLKHADGSYRWILSKAQSLKNESGEIVRITGSHRDITRELELEEYAKGINKMKNVVIDISTRFINADIDNISDELNNALAILGNTSNADRVYIFENTKELGISKNTFEWCRKGISPQIHNLQFFPIDISTEWFNKHVKGETFHISDVDEIEDENIRNLLKVQEIKSVISIPLINRDKEYIGFVGFDYVKNNHVAQKDEVEILKLFSQILVNIYEKIETQRELKDTKSKLESILTEIQDAVWSASYPELKIQFISSSVERIFGFPKEEWLNEKLDWEYSVHPDDLKIVHSIPKLLEKKGHYQVVYRIITKDNKIKWLQNSGKIIFDSENEKPIRLDGAFSDITELKEKELDLIAANKNIKKQNEKLVSFSQILSHNIRSYSSNFLGLTQLLQQSNDEQEKLEYIKLIETVSNKMDETVRNLNDFLILESQKEQVSEEEVEISDLLKNIERILHAQIQQSKITLTLTKDEPIILKGNSALFESILLNLISNSIKYSTKKPNPKIAINCQVVKDKILIQVCDNGIGIDLKKYRDKLFKPGKTFHSISGSGLGMYIIKEHVEFLKGSISVESEVGKGTCVNLSFRKK